jgi:hypothetical protein
LKALRGDRAIQLRPLEKNKHVSKESFRYRGTARSQNERFVDNSFQGISNYMVNHDVGLPALNLKQARMNKIVDNIRSRLNNSSDSKEHITWDKQKYYTDSKYINSIDMN